MGKQEQCDSCMGAYSWRELREEVPLTWNRPEGPSPRAPWGPSKLFVCWLLFSMLSGRDAKGLLAWFVACLESGERDR